MATITIYDIPDRLHRKLKARAKRNRCSLNPEVLEVLDRSIEREERE